MYYFSLSAVYILIFVRKALNSIELSVNTISIHYIKSSNISVVYTVYCIIFWLAFDFFGSDILDLQQGDIKSQHSVSMIIL